MASRAAGNTALRALLEVSSKVLSLGVFALLARTVSAQAFGDYVAALAITAAAETLSTFGLQGMQTRDTARDHGLISSLPDFMALRLVLAVGNMVALTAIVAAAGASDRLVVLVVLFAATNAVTAVTGCALAVFQAYERMSLFTLASLPNRLLSSLLAAAVLLAGGSVELVAVVGLGSAFLSVAAGVVIVHRQFGMPQARVRPRGWPSVMRRALPMAAQEVVGEVVFRVDAVILTALTTTVVVGLYGASYRLTEATLFLAWSVGSAVLPMFSYLSKDSEPSLSRALEGVIKALMALMIPVAVVFFAFARPIVDLVYGLPEFSGSVGVLRWLAFAIVAYAIGNVTTTLVMVARPGRRAVATIAALAAGNIALNFILIPSYGARGAAAATLFTELAGAIAGLWLVRPVTGRPRLRGVLGPLAAGAAMMAVALPLSGHLFIGAPAAAVAYLAVLVAIESRVAPGDLDVVKGMLLRRRGLSEAVAARG